VNFEYGPPGDLAGHFSLPEQVSCPGRGALQNGALQSRGQYLTESCQ
jgi:hypothetical protein